MHGGCIRGSNQMARMHGGCIRGRGQRVRDGAYARRVYTWQRSTSERWRVCTEGVYAAVTRWRVCTEGVYAAEVNVCEMARMHGGCIRGSNQVARTSGGCTRGRDQCGAHAWRVYSQH
jgi:hypothetical protein